MADLARCALPATVERMEATCVNCHCRKVPAKDGEPVFMGRLEPSGYCQDRFPRVFIWQPQPGWLAKP